MARICCVLIPSGPSLRKRSRNGTKHTMDFTTSLFVVFRICCHVLAICGYTWCGLEGRGEYNISTPSDDTHFKVKVFKHLGFDQSADRVNDTAKAFAAAAPKGGIVPAGSGRGVSSAQQECLCFTTRSENWHDSQALESPQEVGRKPEVHQIGDPSVLSGRCQVAPTFSCSWGASSGLNKVCQTQ
eukprot:5938331-Amphidinium_carterae.2